MKKNSSIIFMLLLGAITYSNAQEGYSSHSIRSVHSSDIMYKKKVTRALDLREKQNLPLFSKNREITSLLIEAVSSGKLVPYYSDSLESPMTIDEFNAKLLTSAASSISTDTVELRLLYEDDWKKIVAGLMNEKYFAKDLYQMEIKEDLLFDKQKSKMIYDIQAITIFIPADHPMNEKGIQMPVASFSYKELVKNVFKDNPKAIWYNSINDAQHKSMSDAFDLRLFTSYIIKVSNPNDSYLVDIYGGDQVKGIMASQWAAHEMLEYEHNLWEF